jgi:hypothetical protein
MRAAEVYGTALASAATAMPVKARFFRIMRSDCRTSASSDSIKAGYACKWHEVPTCRV